MKYSNLILLSLSLFILSGCNTTSTENVPSPTPSGEGEPSGEGDPTPGEPTEGTTLNEFQQYVKDSMEQIKTESKFTLMLEECYESEGSFNLMFNSTYLIKGDEMHVSNEDNTPLYYFNGVNAYKYYEETSSYHLYDMNFLNIAEYSELYRFNFLFEKKIFDDFDENYLDDEEKFSIFEYTKENDFDIEIYSNKVSGNTYRPNQLFFEYKSEDVLGAKTLRYTLTVKSYYVTMPIIVIE